MAEIDIKPNGTAPLQFSVMLKNRAGALSSLVRLLRNENIQVIGLSIQDSKDAAVIRLVVSDPDNTMRIFMEKGIPHTTSQLCVIALSEAGIGLGRALETLRAAETNLDFAYSLMPHPEGKTLMAKHLEDTQFGASVLHNAGFKVFYEEDLIR